MNKTIITLTILSSFSSIAIAGDHGFIIAINPDKHCGPPIASRQNNSYPVKTPFEVATDIKSYYTGTKSKTSIWGGVFLGGGRWKFCSNKAREAAYEAFLYVLTREKVKKERVLIDHVFLLGNTTFTAMVEEELKKDYSVKVKKRLQKVLGRLKKKYAR